MHSGMVEAICRIGIFIICAQMLVHFRPDSSYEKYLKMLVSIMILLQVLQPLSSLINGREKGNLQERAAWFEEQLNSGMREAAERREQAEELREQMTLEEVQKRMDAEKAEEIEPVEEIRIDVGIGGEADEGTAEGDASEVVPQG